MNAVHGPGATLLLERAVIHRMPVEGEIHKVEIVLYFVDFGDYQICSGHRESAVYKVFLQINCKQNLSVGHSK